MNAETQKMIAEADARLGREMEAALGPIPEPVTGMRFSEMEMNEAFKRIQNPKDWRDPINCVVAEPDPVELEKIREAVEFYTATECTIKNLGGPTNWVTATGYRNGPAGP